MKTRILLVLLSTLMIFSCKKEGCTDPKSLTYDEEAKKDDGTCEFSNSTFYLDKNTYLGYQISNCELSINGTHYGDMNTTYYPFGGPGNCSATGTLAYQFQDSESIEWNSTITLVGSTDVVYGSGTASPNAASECVKIAVTP